MTSSVRPLGNQKTKSKDSILGLIVPCQVAGLTNSRGYPGLLLGVGYNLPAFYLPAIDRIDRHHPPTYAHVYITMTTMTPLQVFRRQQLASLLPIANNSARFLSTITSPANSTQNASSNPKAAVTTTTTTEKPHTIDPRWLTTMKRRIGKCMMFGLKPGQIQEAGKILQQLARDWRELVAGSEGYLTNDKRRSLFRYNVAWGEMV